MRKVYLVAGAKSVSMGRGRSEFKSQGASHFLNCLKSSLDKTLLGHESIEIDEAYLGNFMAGRFVKQAHLAAFLPGIIPALAGKPCVRVEGACASGGLALWSAIKAIRSGEANTVLACGVEVQSHEKGLYIADILSAAADYEGQRASGAAFFFPGLFSARAKAYGALIGQRKARRAMARWYEQSIKKARDCPEAQEYENRDSHLLETAMRAPDVEHFLADLNFSDCSKVSDGAASILVCSEKGLLDNGFCESEVVELLASRMGVRNIKQAPKDLCAFTNMAEVARALYDQVTLRSEDLSSLELHDCFSISGLLALEALGLAERGEAAQMLESGFGDSFGPKYNTTGGLIGYGHPVGATGVRQMVDLADSLDSGERGMMMNMGGDDVTAAGFIIKKDF